MADSTSSRVLRTALFTLVPLAYLSILFWQSVGMAGNAELFLRSSVAVCGSDGFGIIGEPFIVAHLSAAGGLRYRGLLSVALRLPVAGIVGDGFTH
jgi:hypothetical protein